VWTKHGARGGEFGIRFTNIDGASAAALWDMCGLHRDEGGDESADPSRNEADEGTRVRLHIDGLTSPMKARVRGAVGKELLVGSNLEFLKVGRALELENVDQGGKRPAHIDRVDVELDKESRVPQLVVTLRYDDMSADPPAVVPFPTPPPPYFPPSPSVAVPVTTGSPAAEEPPPLRAAAPPPPQSVPVAIAPPAPPVRPTANSVSASGIDDRTPEEIELARMMRSKASIVAADAMVKVAGLGVRAKAALGEALSKAMQRSRQARDAEAPRRKTSPPPGGALHASGKRVVRDGSEGQDGSREDGENRSKFGRKALIAVGSATGLVTISVVAMLSRGSGAPPGAERSPELAAAPTAQASEPPPNASGALEAKVPLFGPTMVATAETPASAAPTPASTSASPIKTLAFGGSPTMGSEAMDRKDDGDDGKSKHGKPAPFGHGKVEHAMVLHVKTDGAIADMHGVRSAAGFTLTLPGRRTLESGTNLAARDPRIASVRVANNAKGSELTFQFKGGVPPYLVSPSGHDLQLSLGRPETAHEAAKDAPHRTATAQKRSVEAPHRVIKR
jgi:hypothetical protein